MRNAESIPEIIENLNRIFQELREYLKAAERGTSLSMSQLRALKIIASSSFLRISDLAHEMYLSPATVVGIVDRLEEKGLVTRIRSKIDRRTVEVCLTENGQEIICNTNEIAQAPLVKGLEKLSDEQIACVGEGLKLIEKMLDAEQIEPQPLHG